MGRGQATLNRNMTFELNLNGKEKLTRLGSRALPTVGQPGQKLQGGKSLISKGNRNRPNTSGRDTNIGKQHLRLLEEVSPVAPGQVDSPAEQCSGTSRLWPIFRSQDDRSSLRDICPCEVWP